MCCFKFVCDYLWLTLDACNCFEDELSFWQSGSFYGLSPSVNQVAWYIFMNIHKAGMIVNQSWIGHSMSFHYMVVSHLTQSFDSLSVQSDRDGVSFNGDISSSMPFGFDTGEVLGFLQKVKLWWCHSLSRHWTQVYFLPCISRKREKHFLWSCKIMIFLFQRFLLALFFIG